MARATRFLKEFAKPAVQDHKGDQRTWQTACDVRDMGISRELCGELMWEHYNERCSPHGS